MKPQIVFLCVTWPQFNYQSSSTCISECGTPTEVVLVPFLINFKILKDRYKFFVYKSQTISKNMAKHVWKFHCCYVGCQEVQRVFATLVQVLSQ